MALSKLTKVQTLGIGSNIEVVGVITTGQFKSGTSNLHSSGVELTNLNVTGIITASSFSGDGSGLIGVASTDNIVTGTAATFNTYPVDINAGMTVAGVVTFAGNVSIAGTLTYEDVTNIDSVGIITGKGADINGDLDVDGHTNLDNVSIAGVTTFSGNINSDSDITTTADITSRYLTAQDVFITGVSPEVRFVDTDNNPDYQMRANSGLLVIKDFTNGVNKLVFNTSGMVATGILTATSFSGDGSTLSNLPAGAPVGGASTNTVFFENAKEVAVNYQITTNKNAMSAGPIAINAGIAVTVPSGSAWTIV